MRKHWKIKLFILLFCSSLILIFQNCSGGIVSENMESAGSETQEQAFTDEELGTDSTTVIQESATVSAAAVCTGKAPGTNVNPVGSLYGISRIKQNFGTVSAVGFVCPPTPPAPAKFDPPTFYLSDGITQNPMFASHMKPFNDYITKLNQLGDLYLASQSSTVASCVMNWATAWSNTTLLTEYNVLDKGRLNYTTTQGDYERKWLVGEILFNFAKIKYGGVTLNATKVTALKTWLGKSMLPIRLFYDNRIRYNATTGVMERPENLNNHQYWAAVTVYLYGSLFADTSHKNWGVLQYQLGVKSIRNNGTLATEMARGNQAFIYHQFALQPLVMMAELSALNGQSLYTYQSSRLSRLVSLMIRSFQDFSQFTSLTTTTQVHSPQKMIDDLPYYLDWMEIWYSRFADTRLPQFILAARSSPRSTNGRLNDMRLGGDMTLAWGAQACYL